MSRRKHSKIAALPPEIHAAVIARLDDGHTYEAIADWLSQMGHETSKSAVGRFGKDWAGMGQRLKEARAQAAALVEEIREHPNSDLAEATEQMLFTMVAETLAQGKLEIKDKTSPVALGHMIADLSRAGLNRDKLKLDFKKEFEAKAAKAATEIEKMAKSGGLSDETAEKIRRKILGIAQ